MTSSVDITGSRVAGGFFLLRSDGVEHLPVRLNSSADRFRFIYTYGVPDREAFSGNLREAVLRQIRRARRKIFIASFRIGDHELMQALYAAADRLRGGVYIISALDERSLARGLAEIEDDTGMDIQAQNKQFDDMTRRGIYVRGHENCHAKFMVVDGETAVVSSANLESRALNLTGECGAVMDDPAQAALLERFFTRLWFSGSVWEIAPGRGYTVRRRRPQSSPCAVNLPDIAAKPGLVWTHDEEQLILASIRDIIVKAQKELILSTFSLTGMGARPELLLNPLLEAIAGRKIRVRLLLRARNHRSDTLCDAALLAKNRVEIVADSLNHAKGVIADGRHGALFSANFDAAHGLTRGVEVGVRLDGTTALRDAWRYFEHAMAHADRQFIIDPTHAQLDQRLDCQWMTSWPFGDRVPVTAGADDWRSFVDEASRGPVLYQIDREGGAVRLVSAYRVWALKAAQGGVPYRFSLEPPPPRGLTTKSGDLLAEWMRGPARKGEEVYARGFCACRFERCT